MKDIIFVTHYPSFCGDKEIYDIKESVSYGTDYDYRCYFSEEYAAKRIADGVSKNFDSIYKIDDKVWFMDDNKCHYSYISGSNICCTVDGIHVTYMVKDYTRKFNPYELFCTKEELLKTL